MSLHIYTTESTGKCDDISVNWPYKKVIYLVKLDNFAVRTKVHREPAARFKVGLKSSTELTQSVQSN